MKRTASLLLLTAALALPARGQGRYQPGASAMPGDNNNAGDQTDNYQAPAEAAPSAMSLDDARMNFGSVIDAFVAKQSPEGYWPLKEKSTGAVLRLVPVSKDLKSVQAAGSGLYSGAVTFRDEKSGDTVMTEFTVDFGGTEWKVKSMKLVGKTAAKKPAAKAAPKPAK